MITTRMSLQSEFIIDTTEYGKIIARIGSPNIDRKSASMKNSICIIEVEQGLALRANQFTMKLSDSWEVYSSEEIEFCGGNYVGDIRIGSNIEDGTRCFVLTLDNCYKINVWFSKEILEMCYYDKVIAVYKIDNLIDVVPEISEISLFVNKHRGFVETKAILPKAK